jgi:hypothetical protein
MLAKKSLWQIAFLFLACAILTGHFSGSPQLQERIGINLQTKSRGCLKESFEKYLSAYGYLVEDPTLAKDHLRQAQQIYAYCGEKNQILETRISSLERMLLQ